MFRLDAGKRVHFCDSVSRRDFLHAGALGMVGLSMPEFLRLKALGFSDRQLATLSGETEPEIARLRAQAGVQADQDECGGD